VAVGSACVACNVCDPLATNVVLPGGRFTGSTSGTSNQAGSCGGGSTPEAVFKLVLTASSDVFVTTHGSSFNTLLYMRSACCNGAEIACNDNADGQQTSVIQQRGLAAGTYYIFVDGGAAGAMGAYSVDVYAMPTSPNVAENCATPIRLTSAGVAGASNCGYVDDYAPSCGALPMTGGPDLVYYFVTTAASTTVTINTCTNTCIDTILYIRDTCNSATSERVCNDDSCRATGTCYLAPAALQSMVSVSLGPGVHYLVADQYGMAPATLPCGGFSLTATGIP
jgi:hypothetical protein